MSLQTLKKIDRFWRARNPREQKLALVVGVLLGAMLLMSVVQGSLLKLRQLDTEISRLQDDILMYHDLIGRKQIVESQYSRVATQHSSAWSAPEIQERLRQEIYRLARKTPPPLNEEGIPTTTTSTEGNLVEIPALGQGSLGGATDEEYRQYSIGFRVPPTEFTAVLAFLERLQSSPQSLRIDGLELIRQPDNTQVTAHINLTRIIVAGQVASASAYREPDPLNLDPAQWHGEGCTLTPAGDSLEVRAMAEEAVVYSTRALPAGATYELVVELAGSVSGTLGIGGPDGDAFTGAVPLRDDGGAYRYVLRFTVPLGSVQPTLQLPLIRFGGESAFLRITHVALSQVLE